MTISSYLAGNAMEFSKLPVIVWISVIAEWICFLCFSVSGIWEGRQSLSFRSARKGAASFLLLFFSVILEFRFYPIALHCMIQIILWTAFLCICYEWKWHNSVFESCFFCLLLELGKALFRGGTLAWALWKWFPDLSPKRISHITFAVYLIYMLLLSLIFLRIARRRDDRNRICGPLSFGAAQVAALMVPLLLYMMIRQLQSGVDTDTSVRMYLYLDLIDIAVAGCAIILTIIITNMLRFQESRNELLRKQLLQEQQHSQYLIQKEALNAVNRKYHDLKHYLSAVEHAGSSEELRQFAKEMRKEIDPVETIQETGNQTLDILLAQRIRECQEKEIRFIPYIDGRNICFMNTVDLCTLFGNAMDNAIEASVKITDPSLREISAKIENYGNLVIFRFDNRCDAPVRRKGGWIQTTKEDTASHGYGLASIRETAEKYGGSVSIRADGNKFQLTVIIPVPAENVSGRGSAPDAPGPVLQGSLK